MLVLTRKRGETIRIGNDIVIKVIQMGRSSVKIGIEAPSGVKVLRGELTDFQPMSAAEGELSADDAPLDLQAYLDEFQDLLDLTLDLGRDVGDSQPGCELLRLHEPAVK